MPVIFYIPFRSSRIWVGICFNIYNIHYKRIHSRWKLKSPEQTNKSQNQQTTLAKFDELNWLSVSKMLKFRDAVMAYKCANNLALEYLCAKFKKRSSVHNCTTRNNEKFEIPSFR